MEEDEELLREACAVGNKVAAEFYLKKGVSVNCQHKISRFTPLHWAFSRKQVEIIELLQRYGADETLLDAKGRLPNECKPIEFKPNYIKNPDLNKLWGIPDSRENISRSESRPTTQNAAEQGNIPQNITYSTMKEILVFFSSKTQSNLRGAVFINSSHTLLDLKTLISHQLDEIPESFDIGRSYGNYFVPITAKQMGQNAAMHFCSCSDAGTIKNSDLIIKPKNLDQYYTGM